MLFLDLVSSNVRRKFAHKKAYRADRLRKDALSKDALSKDALSKDALSKDALSDRQDAYPTGSWSKYQRKKAVARESRELTARFYY